MQETKDNDIKIIPIGQLEEARQEEVLIRLGKIKNEMEELETLQIGEQVYN